MMANENWSPIENENIFWLVGKTRVLMLILTERETSSTIIATDVKYENWSVISIHFANGTKRIFLRPFTLDIERIKKDMVNFLNK